ncbi:hypothetical protein B0A52_10151 [Exophiala mesophila]|uniref:Uncharacterized protein n=1 Tax=Exophiala mesophila TaxID=212818 RepID=A0A438MT27_EXOME|nr:hypothetical protein B0A52_10151 [Exophiala mesophila]
MDRQDLARLLFPPNPNLSAVSSSLARPRQSTGNPHGSRSRAPSTSQPPSPLSSKQKFQSHVRDLSDDSQSSMLPAPPSLSSATDRHSQSSSPSYTSRPLPIPKRNDITVPTFITEEREAWSRTSPFARRTRSLRASDDVFLLEPPSRESPSIQPSKHLRELRQFAPLSNSPDFSDRPRTSRGDDPGFGSFASHNDPSLLLDLKSQASRFAEGSMNNRSAGVASTWLQNGTAFTSSEEDTDHEFTPKQSPQRSSLDINEFKPDPVTPATLKQRLARFGSAFKPHHNQPSTNAASGSAPEEHKKRRGLRKSLSMWSLSTKGGKVKSVDDSATKKHPSAVLDLHVLDERKRRAEEAYAQQFSSKRRKSPSGLPELVSDQEYLDIPNIPASTRHRSSSSRPARRVSASSSSMASADHDQSESQSDIDLRKRPSRRELEKENQQLRALLREQASTPRELPKPPVSQPQPVDSTPVETCSDSVNNTSRDTTNLKKTPKKKVSNASSKDPPPVPPVPERVALKPLTNARNQTRQLSTSTSISNVNANASSTTANDPSVNIVKRYAPSVGQSRPVSTILEEDESNSENRTPLKLMTSDDFSKMKQLTPTPIRLSGVRRESWEWPDDVF